VNIVEQRAEHYGDPRQNLDRIAGLWTAYIGYPVTAHDVAQMMVLTKISRSKVSNHDDNYADAIGYTEIARDLR
jgi:Domain of unknown function (DUF6378)